MMTIFKRPYVLAALLAASRLAAGQSAPPNLSAVRSDAWMDSVRRLPLPAQVAAVRARVLADTVLRHPRQLVCLMPLNATQRAAYHLAQQPYEQAEAARPAGPLPLYRLDEYSLADNHPTQATAFVQQLDSHRVQSIQFIPSSAPMAVLYGTRGSEGVILLSTKPAPKRR